MQEREQQSACAQDCLQVVAYVSLLGQVVTPTAVWRWLYRPQTPWTVVQVQQALEELHAQSRICLRDGRVVLAGHEDIFDTAPAQFLDAHEKWARARRAARWASWIPGVRMVAVGNTLAWEATGPDSDIDLFVIAYPGTLWYVRLLCVAPLLVLHARPGQRARNPIDFTFFLASDALNIEPLRLQPDDPYLAYWLASLVPLVDDGVFETFWEENSWMHGRLPNAQPCKTAWYRRVRIRVSGVARVYELLRRLGATRALDTVAEGISRKRFPAAIREHMNRSSNVVVNTHMLKFHVTDNRAAIRDRWQSSISQL